MLVWVGSLRFSATGHSLANERGLTGLGRTFGGLAGAAVISQVVLTSSPVALALTGGAAASVTSLFAALAVFRAPYLLLLGLTARITGTLTRAAMAGNERRLRLARWSFVGGAVGLAAVFWVFGVTIGEEALQVLFGPTVSLDRVDFGGLAIGSGLAMGGILLVLLLLARGRTSAAMGACGSRPWSPPVSYSPWHPKARSEAWCSPSSSPNVQPWRC